MPHYVHFRDKKGKVILNKNYDLSQSKVHSHMKVQLELRVYHGHGDLGNSENKIQLKIALQRNQDQQVDGKRKISIHRAHRIKGKIGKT